MKSAIITDTHWGVRNDNRAFLSNFQTFYKDIFFPELEKRGITQIYHLGDVFDRRKYVNYVTLNTFNESFINPIVEKGLEVDGIVGNHDTYFKSGNHINSLKEVIEGRHDNIRFYWEKPKEVRLGDTKILMVPWINSSNYAESMDIIKKTKASIVFGHFDIQGFRFNSGKMVDSGFDKRFFKRFELVMTGHYHLKQSQDNIQYLGAPYEMNWGDYNQPKGFHIFDSETRKLEFVRNTNRMYYKVVYDDKDKTIDEMLEKDLSFCNGCYVKVIITNKENPHLFDLFMDNLYKATPANIQVVEDHLNYDSVSDSDLIDQTKDTLTIMQDYVNNLSISIDKKKIDNVLTGLYNEALSMDVE